MTGVIYIKVYVQAMQNLVELVTIMDPGIHLSTKTVRTIGRSRQDQHFARDTKSMAKFTSSMLIPGSPPPNSKIVS